MVALIKAMRPFLGVVQGVASHPKPSRTRTPPNHSRFIQFNSVLMFQVSLFNFSKNIKKLGTIDPGIEELSWVLRMQGLKI